MLSALLEPTKFNNIENGITIFSAGGFPLCTCQTGFKILSFSFWAEYFSILDKYSSEKTKATKKSAENINDAKFEESEELLSIEDDLILDEEEDSSELDDELLEDDDQDTVPLEEITDVASTDSEEN